MNRLLRTACIVFLVIFLLTQDYLFLAEWPEALWGGLPVWLFYFVAVHLVFILAIYKLSESEIGNR